MSRVDQYFIKLQTMVSSFSPYKACFHRIHVNVISNMQINNYNEIMTLATGVHAEFFIGGDNLAPNILVTIISHQLDWTSLM